MNFKDCTVTLSVVAFLVVLTPRSSFAFSIVPANPEDIQFYRKESGYQVKNLEGKTLLSTKLWWDSNTWNDEIGGVKEIQRGGTGEFKRMLSFWSFFSSDRWDFKSAQNDLEGSFKILTYQACGVNDGCGGASTNVSPINPSYRGVGSLFHIEYHPEGNDPRPGQGNLHWIQLVQANYHRKYPYGFPYVEIDNGGNKQDPYYDTGSKYAGENFFIDQSYSPYGERHHYFNAQLYLVQEVTPPGSSVREVTIYNGIRWGWKNLLLPRVCPNGDCSASAPPEPPPTCDSSSGDGGSGGGSGGGGCSDNNGWGDERDNRELPLFDEDEFDEDDFYVDGIDETDTVILPDIALAPCQSQAHAVLPSETDEDWKVFNDIPSTCWFDPPTNYGFEFQALENTLFTELLDFPTGIDSDDRFTVQFGEEILGEFSPGESVDFVSLVGSGVAEFKILDIETQEDLADVPFKLGFNQTLASFQMRAISEPEEIPQSIPEPGSVAGILTIGLLGIGGFLRKRK